MFCFEGEHTHTPTKYVIDLENCLGEDVLHGQAICGQYTFSFLLLFYLLTTTIKPKTKSNKKKRTKTTLSGLTSHKLHNFFNFMQYVMRADR